MRKELSAKFSNAFDHFSESYEVKNFEWSDGVST